VEERTSGGTIVVAGARNDSVNGLAQAGSAELFVGGQFVTRLTAGAAAEAGAQFGYSVDVDAGLIVVGAPYEGGEVVKADPPGDPQGAVYIFNPAGNLVAKLSPGRAPGNPGAISTDTDPAHRPVNRFGTGVAIDGTGDTIVVAANSSYAQRNTATVFVFPKPAGGWANTDTDDSTVVKLSSSGASFRMEQASGVAISGDGSTIAQGYQDDAVDGFSRLVVHEKGGGWADDLDSTEVTLRWSAAPDYLRRGSSIGISDNGDMIVTSGHSRYTYPPGVTAGTPGAVIARPGRALIWERGSGTWAEKLDFDINANLVRAGAENGDRVSSHVAVNGDGTTIVISNAWKQANNYAGGEALVFTAADSQSWSGTPTPVHTLTSPQQGGQLFFGAGVAIDGNTIVVGQPEAVYFIAEEPNTADRVPIESGRGRACSFDLSATDVQASGAELPHPTVALSTCMDTTADGVTTWTCDLTTVDAAEDDAAMINIPAGTPDGTFTISGSVMVEGAAAPYTASLEVEIGTVDEVAAAAFGFAPNPAADNAPYPATIPAGGETVLQLGVLNENGTASAAGSIASILFTTTSGSLSLLSPDSGCEGGGLACQVDVDALNADNSNAIQIQLDGPGAGQSGTATVSATVLSGDGETFRPDPLEVTFAGAAETLMISEPPTSLLNVNTPDAGDDLDNRDALTLSVSAADASGNSVLLDTLTSVQLEDPDGKAVSGVVARLKIERDANGDPDLDDDGNQQLVLDAAGNPQVELDVEVEAANALATGAYTLEVKAAGKTATQTINVSAGAAAVMLSVEGTAEIGQRLTATATVTDADGNAVADGTPVTALHSVDLALALGSTTAVVGRSGSGKTTLLHVAAGIDLPDSGAVQLLGRDLATMRDRERAVFRRDHLGLVFQFFRLLRHLTVEENVTLPALIAGEAGRYRKRSRELLERVGLGDRARDRIDGLSGGEQQRVAICRALLRRPSVLLADEPTGNLDDQAAKAVMKLMLNLVRDEKKTLLFVTHSVEAAALADRRLELASGRLKA